MRIVCPSCSAAFEVPEGRLTPGQAVRCARCGTDWTPLAELEPMFDAPAVDPAEPPRAAGPVPLNRPEPPNVLAASSPIADQPAPGVLVRSRLILDRVSQFTGTEAALIAGWAASIALVIGMTWAAVAWRGEVMRTWPPSERIYTALGLTTNR